MNMDLAHYLLTEPRKENPAVAASPAKEAYRKVLAEKLLNNITRILTFRNKDRILKPCQLISVLMRSKPSRRSSTDAFPSLRRGFWMPQSSLTITDYYLNLLDWGSSNVLSIGLGSTVYLWDASSSSTTELVTIDEGYGPVTSICWAPDGRHIAIGLNSSDVQRTPS